MEETVNARHEESLKKRVSYISMYECGKISITQHTNAIA